jgi:NAD(P)H-hydrate epimerase
MAANKSITRQQARDYDAGAIARGIPGRVLMENAASGAVEVLLSQGVSGPVAIVCGKGNNGGDGYVIARLLHERKILVSIEAIVDPHTLSGDALDAWRSVPTPPIPIHVYDGDATSLAQRLQKAEWIVDALLGTGAIGPVRPPFDKVIAEVNASGRKILAVDLPSGLDADAGVPLGPTIRADCTVTFVAPKIGFSNPQAAPFVGSIHVVDIGAGDVE